MPAPTSSIETVATALELSVDDWEPRGRAVAKFAPDLHRRLQDRPVGRYVGVTSINPTPLGEGKTVVTIGLAMALHKLGHRAICTLREPSLGPVFGIKGGGAGGGKAHLVPEHEINLHFTGDLHAVTSANNLLAAMIDNHVARGLTPAIEPSSVAWRRVLDVNDKGLSRILTGIGGFRQALERETAFELTAASEVMAILGLAESLSDLRSRLGRILIGTSPAGKPVTAEDIGAAGAMCALLRDAIRPNLVQTCEQTPAIVHTGPFANIAYGNSSVIADRTALHLADFVVTESGFGADCGAEKLFDIKCRHGGLTPSAEVLICTVRSLKIHSGRFAERPGRRLPPELFEENLNAIEEGADNLRAHVHILQQFQIPIVIAINRFPTDTPRELETLQQLARETGVEGVAVTDEFARGSAGAMDLAAKVVEASSQPGRFQPLYPLNVSLTEKLRLVATRVYGADDVTLSSQAQDDIHRATDLGFSNLPVCIAKTQYSLSHDPKRLGRPKGFLLPVREVRVAAGAGYVYALAGDISTMPGLPKRPTACRIDVDANGEIVGM